MPGKLRVLAAWLLALPFLVFARPTLPLLATGAGVASLGLWLRAWAAGSIDKGKALAISGPYAFTRNPLYLGSFLIGLGLTVAGGDWMWTVLFVAFFLAFYVPTMRAEAVRLEELFGDRFGEYTESVPVFVPRLTPYRDARAPERFRWERYLAYREWEAALGVVAALLVLTVKLLRAG